LQTRESIKTLADFVQTDASHRRVVLLGNIKEQQALLIVEKSQFEASLLGNLAGSLEDVKDRMSCLLLAKAF